MTRTALTKLLFLVIIAFILCLPEFFTVHRVLSVSLRCVRPQLSEEEEAAVVWSNSTCPEQWKHLLGAAADQRNVTQTDTSCFVCQANVNMPELDHNSSSSDETVYFEVALEQNDTISANLTLFGHSHDPEYLHLSDQGDHNYALLHCPQSRDGANRSCCLFLLSNRTLARGGLPWKRTTEETATSKQTSARGEWRCVLRVTWLSLLCLVLLIIVITVAQQILEGRKRNSDKSKIHPFNSTSQGQHLIDTEKSVEVNTRLDTRGPYSWSALSSIEEVVTPEETEGEVFFSNNDRNGNIHHRNSHSPSIKEG